MGRTALAELTESSLGPDDAFVNFVRQAPKLRLLTYTNPWPVLFVESEQRSQRRSEIGFTG